VAAGALPVASGALPAALVARVAPTDATDAAGVPAAAQTELQADGLVTLAQHGAQGAGALAALRVERHAQLQGVALPLLLLGLGVVDDARVDRKVGQRLPLPGRRQTLHAQGQRLTLDARLHPGRRQRLGLGGQRGLEGRAVGVDDGAGAQAQQVLALLGDAALAAHQPAGRQLHHEVAAGQGGRQAHRHRQQQLALVAVVQQRPEGQLVRRRPADVVGLRALRQGPVQLRGQAGIARVLPVGVPVRRVPDGQTEPQRLARRQALRGVGQQLGAGVFGLQRGRRRGRGQHGQRQRDEKKDAVHGRGEL
jgi:hypothetical protein